MTTTPTFWGNEVTFSPFAGDFGPQVRALSDGTFAVVWDRDGTDIVGRHLDELGSFTSGDFLSELSGSTAKPLSRPQILEQTDGRAVVNYTEQFAAGDRDIRWHRPNEDFTPPHPGSFGTESLQTNGTTTDEVLLDSTARAGGGAANVFSFTDFGSSNLVLRFTDAIGNQASNRIFVGPHAGQVQQNPALAGLHTGFVAVAYENFNPANSTRDVRLHVYAPNENDVSGEVTVSAPGSNASFPDITALRDGSFVVAWQQAGGIAFQHFIGNGTPTDPTPTLVPGSSTGLLPKVTALNDGGIIVAWTGFAGTEGDGSPELEVFLQRFSNGGDTVGARVQLDEPGDQGLFGMSVATLDDGRMILTYGSETGDSTNVTTLNYRVVDPREASILGTNGDDNFVGREDGSQVSGLDGNDKLTGRGAADTLNGGDGADNLRGFGAGDALNGGPGNDTLFGGTGNDTLNGNPDNDVLRGEDSNDLMVGGTGKDMQTGGTGADRFDLNSSAEAGLGAARDIVLDFSRGQLDKIDFATIDAKAGVGGNQAFSFIGPAGFGANADGQLRANDLGSTVILQASTDADRAAEFEIEVRNFTGTFVAGDFVL